jgi:hypothetical protein
MRRWKIFKNKTVPSIYVCNNNVEAIMDVLVVKEDVMNCYDFIKGNGFTPWTFSNKMVYSVEEWMEEFENGIYRHD